MLLWFPSSKSKSTILALIQGLDRSTFPQRVQDLIHSRYPAFDHYKVYVDTNFEEIDTTCAICYESGDFQLNCGHIFHRRCLAKWKKTCPMCRASY